MALSPRSFVWKPNADGTIDGHYKDGDKPTGGLSWNLALSLLGLSVGTPLSVNVRTGLSGANAATAGIVVLPSSGDDPIASGFVSPGSGNNLTAPVAAPHSGFLKLEATDSVTGQKVVSPAIPWSFVAVTAADTLAPTIPTGFKITPKVGALTFEHDASSDPYDGANNAAHLKDYRVRKDNVVVHTQTTGVVAGLSPVLQLFNIGSITLPGPPTAIQSGANWALSAAGTGFHGTGSDQLAFLAVQISGDVIITVKVPSFTGPGPYSPCGPMIRGGVDPLDPTAPFAALYFQPNTPGGNGEQAKIRTNAGLNSFNIHSDPAFDAPGYLQLQRYATEGKVVFRRSPNGSNWTNLIERTDVALNPAVWAGIALSSQVAGQAVSVTIEQLNINNAGPITYDVTAASGGTWTVSARDNAGTPNESAVSISIAATPLVGTPSTAVKVAGGHYAFFTSAYWNDTQKAGITSLINSLAGDDDIRGILYMPLWRQAVSGGSPDADRTAHYAKLREIMDYILGLMQSISPDKYLMFGLRERAYGQGAADTLPQYLLDMGQYVQAPVGADGKFVPWSGGLTCCAKVWDAPTRDYTIDFGKYLAQQYDSVDNFTMFTGGESSLGVPIGVGGFDYPGFTTQTKRVFEVLKGDFKQTMMRWKCNFWDTPDNLLAMYEYLRTVTKLGGVCFGGPDPEFDLPFPSDPATAHRTITANRLWCGDTRTAAGAWQNGGGFDYRTKDPWATEWQEFGMAGVRSGYDEPPADIHDYGYNKMLSDYQIWISQNYTGNTAQKWPGVSGLKAYLNSLNGQKRNNIATLRGSYTAI